MHRIDAFLRNVHISCSIVDFIGDCHAIKRPLRLRVQVIDLLRTELTTNGAIVASWVTNLSLSSSSCHSSLLSLPTSAADLEVVLLRC